jgi:hypothetical protein
MMPVEVDASAWSGEGALTHALLDSFKANPTIASLRVEDAPSSRSDASFSFVSNEIFVRFAIRHGSGAPLSELAATLGRDPSIGPPDYTDAGMLQYLRTERVLPAYQTRGFKAIEMVRIYELEPQPHAAPSA